MACTAHREPSKVGVGVFLRRRLSFYLLYRLHASPDQLRRAYPAWESAMQAKSRFDPDGIFNNGLYEAYGRA
jgi:hypothetical protein